MLLIFLMLLIMLLIFRAKFTNDLNLFVCEIGRGKGVLECSLEIIEVLKGAGRR